MHVVYVREDDGPRVGYAGEKRVVVGAALLITSEASLYMLCYTLRRSCFVRNKTVALLLCDAIVNVMSVVLRAGSG